MSKAKLQLGSLWTTACCISIVHHRDTPPPLLGLLLLIGLDRNLRLAFVLFFVVALVVVVVVVYYSVQDLHVWDARETYIQSFQPYFSEIVHIFSMHRLAKQCCLALLRRVCLVVFAVSERFIGPNLWLVPYLGVFFQRWRSHLQK